MFKNILPIIICIILIASVTLVQQLSLNNLSSNTLDDLENIKKSIEKEDWENAFNKAVSSLHHWKEKRHLAEVLIDHNELDVIETNFIEAKELIRYKEKGEAYSKIIVTINLIEHLPRKTKLKIENIL